MILVGIENDVKFEEYEQLPLKDKKQFLVHCLNESCANAFADFTVLEGAANFRVSTHLYPIPIISNSVANNSNQYHEFHHNRICVNYSIAANESVSCENINATYVSHFYIEIENQGFPAKLEGSLKLLNVHNVTEGSKSESYHTLDLIIV